MALGASGASAAEVPSDAGLLGSVTGAVGSVSSPSTLPAIADPLATATTEALPAAATSRILPLVPDLVAQVPQFTTQPTGTILTPLTSLVDEVVAEVPIVQSVIPAGTVTDVTAPIVDAVDGTVGEVKEPVLEVVAPVVDVVDPVVGVVAPLPGGVTIPAVPLPSPEQVAGVLPDVPSADAPAEAATAAVSHAAATGAVTTDAIPTDRMSTGSAVPAPSDTLVPDAGSTDPRAGVQTSTTLSGASGDVVVPAVLAGIARIAHDRPATPLASWAGTLSSMTGAGTAGPSAAIGGAALLVFLALVGPVLRRGAAGLPAGPAFDPGSSPD